MSHPGPYRPQPNEPRDQYDGPGTPDQNAAEPAEQYEVYVPSIGQSTSASDSASTGQFYPLEYGQHAAADQRSGHPAAGFSHRPDQSRGPAGPPPRSQSRKTGLWWGVGSLGVVALIITVLVATGVFDAKINEPGANPQATGNYEPPSPDNDALRIIDKDAGISYDYLGEGWKDYTWAALVENQKTVGQFVTTQSLVPGGGDFIAQVTSGLLSTQFGTPDPSQYASVLADVEASVFGNYYPLPNEPTNQSEESLTIDGHQAYKRSTDLTWDVEGYDSTGERVVLLLIDTGRASPVLFYCSFPNTHAELYPLIEQVIASIRVDQ